jgi:hypothetical protein
LSQNFAQFVFRNDGKIARRASSFLLEDDCPEAIVRVLGRRNDDRSALVFIAGDINGALRADGRRCAAFEATAACAAYG